MRLALLAAVAATLLLTGTVMASTHSLTGSGGYNHPLTLAFTTSEAGPVSATATWTPKGKTRYVLTVKHLRDPADPFSYDQICQVYEPLDGSGSGQTLGEYTCSFTEGLAGYWTAEFRPASGKVTATITVTAP